MDEEKQNSMHKIISDSIEDFKLFIEKCEFRDEEEIQLVENLKIAIDNWENGLKNEIPWAQN